MRQSLPVMHFYSGKLQRISNLLALASGPVAYLRRSPPRRGPGLTLRVTDAKEGPSRGSSIATSHSQGMNGKRGWAEAEGALWFAPAVTRAVTQPQSALRFA
jgi:hypothetical protein